MHNVAEIKDASGHNGPNRLIVFVRAPLLGTVKKRLAASIGPVEALVAYQLLVRTVLARINTCAGVEIRFTPDDAADAIAPWLRPGWHSNPQGHGDLGLRMERAFEDAFHGGAKRVVLIGSDCPDISSGDVEEAWQALGSHDLVLGPAFDGGYWLIALRRPQPAFFAEMHWSTSQVLQETIARARTLGLKPTLLRELSDIDTERDWRSFLARR